MIYNILAALITCAVLLLTFHAVAGLWLLLHQPPHHHWRCPCGRTFEHQIPAQWHEQAEHGRGVENSQIKRLP